jgi:hypothetical protein
MKYGFSLIIFFVLYGCRTDSTVDNYRASEYASFAQKDEQTVSFDSLASQLQASIVRLLQIRETSVVTEFDTLGRVRSISKSRRAVGLREVGSVDARQDVLHIASEKSDSSGTVFKTATERLKKETKTDTRPVQGEDWFWIAAGFSVLAVCVGGVFMLKKYVLKHK